jgi:hypothetical protein
VCSFLPFDLAIQFLFLIFTHPIHHRWPDALQPLHTPAPTGNSTQGSEPLYE